MRYAISGILFAICGMLVSACQGPTSSGLPGGLSSGSHSTAPAPAPTSTPYTFAFHTINGQYSARNYIFGINQLGKVVGMFGGGSGSDIAESYTSRPPYSQMRMMNYPGAQGTTATSLSSNRLTAGFVLDPPQGNGIWAFTKYHNTWTLLKDGNEGSGNNAVTEILGINDSQFAVGFYMNSQGIRVPFIVDTATQQFTELAPPNAVSAEATGINGKSGISGTETLTDGTTQGFYLQTGTYYTLAYPNAVATEALSLNWEQEIVGDYQDAKHQTHGFILENPTAGGQTQRWQSIDVPNAAGTTVVTGISDHHDICGWYIDTAGNINGFIANPKGGK